MDLKPNREPVTLEALLRRLPPDELAKIKPLTKASVDRALAEGRAERERAEQIIGWTRHFP